MRHFKTDVSHRMKRRPSIFTAPWFRAVLALGVLVILGLLLGPSVMGWLRREARPTPIAARPSPPPIKPPAPEPRESPVATAAVPPEPPAPAPSPTNGVTKATEPPKAAPETVAVPPKLETPPAASSGLAVYRIQVGAFLDHRNADRLIERLRSESVEVVNSIVEESRTFYRVLATPQEGEGYPALAGRLHALGFESEPAPDGGAVTRPVPLRSAVEMSRRLREQGIQVRLERQTSSAAFRVVRVGAYDTADAAERARAALLTRGYEGFVVREQR